MDEGDRNWFGVVVMVVLVWGGESRGEERGQGRRTEGRERRSSLPSGSATFLINTQH